MAALPAAEERRTELRERILETFAEGVRAGGPRAVVMAELARDLGISTRTLYQQFPSKSELVRELLERWADEFSRDPNPDDHGSAPPLEQMQEAARTWLDKQASFGPEFWRQVARDYPDAHEVFEGRRREAFAAAYQRLVPHIRDELDPGLAARTLMASVGFAADRRRCEKLGLDARDAVNQVISIWARGALKGVG